MRHLKLIEQNWVFGLLSDLMPARSDVHRKSSSMAAIVYGVEEVDKAAR